MHQRIVAVRMHELAELPARTTEMSLSIGRGIEVRRGVDVAIGPRLQEMREWIPITGHFLAVLFDIPGNVEQRRGAERLAAPMRQEMRQCHLPRRYRICLAIP